MRAAPYHTLQPLGVEGACLAPPCERAGEVPGRASLTHTHTRTPHPPAVAQKRVLIRAISFLIRKSGHPALRGGQAVRTVGFSSGGGGGYY